MSGDWTDDLTDEERDGWEEFVAHARREAVEKIAGSAVMISLVPREPDIKFAVELGLGIMMDKPILALVMPGANVPEHLRRVADLVVEGDVDTDEGRTALSEALVGFMKEHVDG